MIVARRSESLSAPDSAGPQGTFSASTPTDLLPLPQVEGVEHRFVAVNGARLHYAGAGRGDPLVLLHGWPQHWWAWRELIPTLSGRYRVICPDIRGFGWSAAGEPDHSPEQLAADLVGLLDVLGIDRARLVGHGLGSDVGAQASRNWPARFSHYVSVGAVAPWSGGVAAPRQHLHAWQVYALGMLGDVATTRLGVPEHALRAWRHAGAFTPVETQTYLGPLRLPAAVAATRKLYRRALFHDLPHHVRGDHAATPSVRTLRVRGEQDPLAAAPGAVGAEVELVPGCGHFVAEERPSELLELLAAFLD